MEATTRFMLPDDLVLEILVRVKDVAALFRCATACKGWRRLLVADPSFLRRCLSEMACLSSPLAGFFAQLKCDSGILELCLVPAPRPVLAPGLGLLSSFFTGLYNPGFFHDAEPLVSRHGLLLVHYNVHHRTGVHLAVCNLLAGTIQVLPFLEHLELPNIDKPGYALLTTPADCSSWKDCQQQQLPFFKVLVIVICEYPRMYRLRTYSSTSEPRWNMCSGSVEHSDIRLAFRQPGAAVCRGMAHWLLWGSLALWTLEVSAKTGNVSFSMLPVKLRDLYFRVGNDEPYLSVDTEDERLTVIYQQKQHLQLEFWTWDGNQSWISSRVVKLTQPGRQMNKTMYFCVGEKNGTVLIRCSYGRIYVVDCKTQVMQEITDQPSDFHTRVRSSLSRETFVPLEMDWPAYFVSRLDIAQ